ncbi:hypothetical protein PMAYCL1PPCAC_25459, partial [Pristionchus mayeri]
QLLAIQSPVFEALFFGEFTEKGKNEVEIKDVVYEEFIDLLHLLYSRSMRVTDHTVPHILKLADRFQIESLMKESEVHLIISRGFDRMEKLRFADQYRLDNLKDICLDSFTDLNGLASNLNSSPEFANFSADMKAVICENG